MILSVIIPVYNVETFLKRCLDSVKIVDASKTEIIIVDDGATDSSPQICDDYAKKHEYVKVIHQKNGGLSCARNTGIAAASGKFISFLDSDDMVTDNFIEDMLQLIGKYDPDLIDFQYCEERTENVYNLIGNKSVIQYSQKAFIEHLLNNKTGCQSCFRIYRRSIFDNLCFPYNRYYEDAFIFWQVLLKSKKIVSVQYSYYIYNLTNLGAITKKINVKSMADMKQAYDEMCDGLLPFCRDHKINTNLLKYVRINTYVYIGYKLRRAENVDADIKKEIDIYIKKNPVNLLHFRNYDWKKYLVYRAMIGI